MRLPSAWAESDGIAHCMGQHSTNIECRPPRRARPRTSLSRVKSLNAPSGQRLKADRAQRRYRVIAQYCPAPWKAACMRPSAVEILAEIRHSSATCRNPTSSFSIAFALFLRSSLRSLASSAEHGLRLGNARPQSLRRRQRATGREGCSLRMGCCLWAAMEPEKCGHSRRFGLSAAVYRDCRTSWVEAAPWWSGGNPDIRAQVPGAKAVGEIKCVRRIFPECPTPLWTWLRLQDWRTAFAECHSVAAVSK